jgi:hypothetical protein
VDPTPQPPPESSGRQRSERRARVGEVEGWLSLVVIIAPYLMSGVDPGEEGVFMFVGIFGTASLPALDGFRFGRGSGRVAAVVSLSILSLLLLGIVFAALASVLSQ